MRCPLSNSNSVNWISPNAVCLLFYSQWTILLVLFVMFISFPYTSRFLSFSRVTIIICNKQPHANFPWFPITFPVRYAVHPILHTSTTTMCTLMRTFYLPYTQHNLLDQIINLHFCSRCASSTTSGMAWQKNWCCKLSIYSRTEAFQLAEEDSWSTLYDAAPLIKYINFAINDIHLRPSCVWGGCLAIKKTTWKNTLFVSDQAQILSLHFHSSAVYYYLSSRKTVNILKHQTIDTIGRYIHIGTINYSKSFKKCGLMRSKLHRGWWKDSSSALEQRVHHTRHNCKIKVSSWRSNSKTDFKYCCWNNPRLPNHQHPHDRPTFISHIALLLRFKGSPPFASVQPSRSTNM